MPLETVIAPFRYAFPVDAAVHAIKFRRRLEFVPVLGAALADALLAARLDADLLVPVPLNAVRHGIRGFNQALELARPVARATGLPLSDAVSRPRRTRPQTGLDRAARRQNVERAFEVTGESTARHALIIDDVMTTGATVIELAGCLRDNGVERVSALVAARRAGDA
jgi:ComF family protein